MPISWHFASFKSFRLRRRQGNSHLINTGLNRRHSSNWRGHFFLNFWLKLKLAWVVVANASASGSARSSWLARYIALGIGGLGGRVDVNDSFFWLLFWLWITRCSIDLVELLFFWGHVFTAFFWNNWESVLESWGYFGAGLGAIGAIFIRRIRHNCWYFIILRKRLEQWLSVLIALPWVDSEPCFMHMFRQDRGSRSLVWGGQQWLRSLAINN